MLFLKDCDLKIYNYYISFRLDPRGDTEDIETMDMLVFNLNF